MGIKLIKTYCPNCYTEEIIGPFTFYFLLIQAGFTPDEIDEIYDIIDRRQPGD